MKNKVKSQIITQMNINNIRENSLLRKKSPIAIFIATALFVFGSDHAMAAPEDTYTYTNETIGTGGKHKKLYITDTQSVNDMLVHEGFLHMSGEAEAYRTTVLDEGDLHLDGYKPKAFNTKIESGGLFSLLGGASAYGTIVNLRGTMSITRSTSDPIVLRDTTIGGILQLNEGQEWIMEGVQLEGETHFLTGSKLEIGADARDKEIYLTNNGDLIISNNMEIKSGIKGNGKIIIQKDAFDRPEKLKLTLIGRNINDPDDADYDYSGETTLTDGTLQIKQATFHNSPITGIGAEKTELWIGETGSDNKSYLRTTVQNTHVSILNNSHWDMTENSTIYNLNISSLGSINLGYNGRLGNILTIGENYSANSQSLLEFNTQLGNDDSPTDRMIVRGDTSGETNVKVNNIGGTGDKTDFGILLIQVLGESNGEFIQLGRAKAGAFEYKLGRGESDLYKNWYLHSSLADYTVDNNKPTDAEPTLAQGATQPTALAPKEDTDTLGILPDYPDEDISENKRVSSKLNETKPTAHTTNVDDFTVGPHYPDENADKNKPVNIDEKHDAEDAPPAAPAALAAPAAKTVTNDSASKTKAATTAKASSPSQPQVYAPENGSYIANIVMARSLFNTRFEDRSGSYQYKDAVSGQWRTSSMWMRTQGGKNNFGHAVDQLDINGKYYSVQLGMDVIQEGSGRIGVLAGLGKATSHSKSKVTGYYSNGSVDGYNLGVYASWLPEQKDNTGFYIDTLAQYSWFNNTVNGQERAEDKYKSSGFTTSIESGYTFKMATTGQLGYFIQPNAQVTLQGIQTQSHKTAYGELISDDNKGHMVTRIGAKTYLQTVNSQDNQFTPFIAVNWLHQNQNTGAIISGQRVESKSKNSTEFKIGLESKIEQQLHVWAIIDYQMGRYSDNNANALAGIKYHF